MSKRQKPDKHLVAYEKKGWTLIYQEDKYCDQLVKGELTAIVRPESHVCYTARIERDQSLLAFGHYFSGDLARKDCEEFLEGKRKDLRVDEWKGAWQGDYHGTRDRKVNRNSRVVSEN